MLRQGLAMYKAQLDANPLRTKMLTSAFLFSFGDFLCQQAEVKLLKKRQIPAREPSAD